MIKNISKICIQKYETKFDNDFFVLNKIWIEESWILEESDKKDYNDNNKDLTLF